MQNAPGSGPRTLNLVSTLSHVSTRNRGVLITSIAAGVLALTGGLISRSSTESPAETKPQAAVATDPVYFVSIDPEVQGEPAKAETVIETTNQMVCIPLESLVAALEKMDMTQIASLTGDLVALGCKQAPSPQDLEHVLQRRPAEIRASMQGIALAVLRRNITDVTDASRSKITDMRSKTGFLEWKRTAVLTAVAQIIPGENNVIYLPEKGVVQRAQTYATLEQFLQEEIQNGRASDDILKKYKERCAERPAKADEKTEQGT